MNKRLIIFFIIVNIISSCQQAEKKWSLVWSDEFDYEGFPDSSKWKLIMSGFVNK